MGGGRDTDGVAPSLPAVSALQPLLSLLLCLPPPLSPEVGGTEVQRAWDLFP